MGSLFALLIIGTFLIIRYTYRSLRIGSVGYLYQRACQINKQLTDMRLIDNVLCKLSSGVDGRKEILGDISDELLLIFGENWDDYFKHFAKNEEYSFNSDRDWVWPRFGTFDNIWTMAAAVWLAKHGSLSEADGHLIDRPIRGYNESDVLIVLANSLGIIEREMQEHHPDMTLRFLFDKAYPDILLCRWQHDVEGSGSTGLRAIFPYANSRYDIEVKERKKNNKQK